jgi:hypothetical protein
VTLVTLTEYATAGALFEFCDSFHGGATVEVLLQLPRKTGFLWDPWQEPLGRGWGFNGAGGLVLWYAKRVLFSWGLGLGVRGGGVHGVFLLIVYIIGPAGEGTGENAEYTAKATFGVMRGRVTSVFRYEVTVGAFV